MYSLQLLSAKSILDGVDSCQLRATDLVQGSELFLHMLDSPNPVFTACSAAALSQLVSAGAIPMESCLIPLLQATQQATNTLFSINSSSLTPQSEQYALTTLRYAVAAVGSRTMRNHVTPAALPVLLKLLQLPRIASDDDSLQHSSKSGTVSYAQDVAVSILERLCHNTGGRQAFAAAGGIKVLVEGARSYAEWFSDEDSDSAGLCLLCDLTRDPAVAEAVAEAGGVGFLLNELHPHCIDDLDSSLAALALSRLAATALGSRAITAAPRGMRCILKTLAATYKDTSEEAGLLFQGLSMCLFHLATKADCSDALQAAGGVRPYIRSMVDAGFDEQQAKSELRDRCLAQAFSRLSFMEAFGFDPNARLGSDSEGDSDSDSDSD